MANFYKNGDVIDFTAGANLVSGDIVAIGSIVGMVVRDVVSGDQGVLQVEGIIENVPSTGTINNGAVVYWDESEDEATATSGGNIKMGYAVGAASGNLVKVKLSI